VAIHTIDDRIKTISFFTGAGMLELGVELAFGEIFDPIAYVECEAHAAAVIAAAMEQGRLRPAPVWSDARSVCGPLFGHYVRQACLGFNGTGGVDAFIGGYPCPDFSCAGKRAGIRGDKGSLWWSLAEAIAEYEPELLFLENVGGHTSQGFDTVCSSLQYMGYRIAAGLFTASETGASHKRERLFIMGDRISGEASPQHDQPRRSGQQQRGPASTRREVIRQENRQTCPDSLNRSSEELADTIRPIGQPGPRRRGVRESDTQLAIASGGGFRILREPSWGGRFPDRSDETMENAAIGQLRPGRQVERGDRSDGQPDSDIDRPSGELADTECPQRRAGDEAQGCGGQGCDGCREKTSPAGSICETQLPIYPPGPGDLDAWGKILETSPLLEPAVYGKLNPFFVENLMGWPMYWSDIERDCNHEEWARRCCEILRVLCEGPPAKKIRRTIGGSRTVPKTKVLQQGMHGKGDAETIPNKKGLGKTSAKDAEGSLRAMRSNRKPRNSSQKQEVVGQPTGEYLHALRILSHYAAPCKQRYCSKKDMATLSPLWVLDLWQDCMQHLPDADKKAWKTASRENQKATIIATAKQLVMADRTQQLRLLGNGVVPLQAAYAYTTLAACLWGGGSNERGGSRII